MVHAFARVDAAGVAPIVKRRALKRVAACIVHRPLVLGPGFSATRPRRS
jgi:hypothetical protein